MARNLALAETPYLIQEAVQGYLESYCCSWSQPYIRCPVSQPSLMIHDICIRVLLMYAVPDNKYHKGTDVRLSLSGAYEM